MNSVLEGMDGITPADVAERWYARLMAPDCSLKEKEQFENWLRLAPENALAYENTKALWASLGGLDEDERVGPHALAALEPDTEPFMGQWTAAVEHVKRHEPHKARIWIPLTVGMAALLVLGFVGWPRLKPEVPGVPYASTSAIKDLNLEDGSQVQLDLDTSIAVKIGAKQRNIELTGGRAMFEVAHNASRPFVVDAGVGRITALGTRFQVQREGGAVSVTLLEGSVAIINARDESDKRSLRLVPGQKASYAPSTKSWTVAIVDAAALTSWSQRFHVFTATSLSEAIAEINRYSAVKLELATPELGDLPVSGSFKLGDGKAIAQALPYTLPVTIKTQADTILISRR